MTTIYAALDDRVLVVHGERVSHCSQTTEWERTERLVGDRFESLAASAAVPGRVFAGTVDAGLKRSTDSGKTWTEVGNFEDRVTAVTISPHDPDEVWVGTEPSAVYRSTDAGMTWQQCPGLTDLPSADRWSFPPRPQTHHVRSLVVDRTDPDRIYIAIEAGAFIRLTDGGKTFEDHPSGARRDNHTLATHTDAPERVYTAAGDGYAESVDGGESWTYPQEGLDHRYVWGLAVDPGNPETVVVSAANGARSAHSPSTAEAYVYRRAGDGWEQAMEGLPAPAGTVRAVLAAGQRGGEFVALTNRGLFRSHDSAESWTQLDISWPTAYEEKVGRGLAVVQ